MEFKKFIPTLINIAGAILLLSQILFWDFNILLTIIIFFIVQVNNSYIFLQNNDKTNAVACLALTLGVIISFAATY
ncbi:hypothetical protein N782_00900 [Pontibacillus yanchengensis Y32]|uniref:Uncharacterized protein n=1 Tax=Pontibacillus yanchengensis Y32 TaxID=1385514 RepID=A0A0A2TZN0_9BACI|nr:hypothetical protein N782_00900 [Pontibacillus yanchengensis Y32]